MGWLLDEKVGAHCFIAWMLCAVSLRRLSLMDLLHEANYGISTSKRGAELSLCR